MEAAAKKLLTPEDVAARLGVSPRTLEGWRRRGDLNFIKLGSGRTALVRYRPDVVEAWLAERERASTSAQEPPRAAEAGR